MSDRLPGTWRIEDTLAAAIEAEAGAGRVMRFDRGQILYEQEARSGRFFYIRSGLVQISMIREDGSELVLEYMGPKTICGEGAAFDGLARFSGASALEPTEAIAFDAAHMPPVFARNPAFAMALMQITSLKQRVLAVRLEQLAAREPEGRILELFQRLGRMFAEPHPDGLLLVPHLTHEQIAAMTGVTRVTVTRTLARLREAGRIDHVDGRTLLRPVADA